jgi:UDPglucose--hexose-1-phosphate uridylyltransferase
MPELRKDLIVGRWVIISVERGKRPSDFASPSQKRKIAGFCPFCEGNEYTTPEEIMAFRSADSGPNTPGWTVRVVPNKFPALQMDGELYRTNAGIFEMMNGVGTHEVVIESPDHLSSLSTMPLKSVGKVLLAYYQRLKELEKDSRLKYALVFKNEGDAAGASLEHTHSQIIALPIVPSLVLAELDASSRYYEEKKRCIFCDVIEQEHKDGQRIVCENENYLAIAPFAPRAPFETWILPKNHESRFRPINGSFNSLAEILQRVLRQLDRLLDIPPYNYILHTSPFSDDVSESYHWHFEIMPKLTKIAGFEWGSGFYINPTPPEIAAKYMREVQL